MLNKILTFINSNHLFSKNDSILVAFSGGKDSIALLNALIELKYKVSAAHCNFGLRGSESDLDEEFAIDFCNKNKIKLYTIRFETADFAKKNNISIQMAARKLRYDWFKALRSENNIDYVAMAHHQDDVIETLFLNITQGSGPVGLRSIPVKTDFFVRPLWAISQSEILEYLKIKQLHWREDSSNSSNYYARNKFRNQILPLIKEINPGLNSTMVHNVSRFTDLNYIFQENLEKFRLANVKNLDNYLIINLDKNWVGLNLILEEILKKYGFNFDQVQTIVNFETSGKKVQNNDFVAEFFKNQVFVYERSNSSMNEIILEQEGNFEGNDFSITIEKLNAVEIDKNNLQPNVAFLDAENLKFPIIIRKPIVADRFKPLGMSIGSKLISDFVVDAKLNPVQKNNLLLLVSQQQIAWVINHRISEDFKLKNNTNAILKITYNKKS